MLVAYINRELRKAKYEMLEEGTFVATMPCLRGVLASAKTVEERRDQLANVIEGSAFVSHRWMASGWWKQALIRAISEKRVADEALKIPAVVSHGISTQNESITVATLADAMSRPL